MAHMDARFGPYVAVPPARRPEDDPVRLIAEHPLLGTPAGVLRPPHLHGSRHYWTYDDVLGESTSPLNVLFQCDIVVYRSPLPLGSQATSMYCVSLYGSGTGPPLPLAETPRTQNASQPRPVIPYIPRLGLRLPRP